MNELFHKPGFLGTAANWAADMTLVLMIIIAATLTVGVVLARRKRYGAHRWVQTSSVILNVVLVLWLMILPYRDFVAPGVPQLLNEPFYLVTTLHGIVGFCAGDICGATGQWPDDQAIALQQLQAGDAHLLRPLHAHHLAGTGCLLLLVHQQRQSTGVSVIGEW